MQNVCYLLTRLSSTLSKKIRTLGKFSNSSWIVFLQCKNNFSISNVSSESNFKVPLKRPPTRQKPSSISVSVNASSGVKVVKDVENGDDDIISIIGR